MAICYHIADRNEYKCVKLRLVSKNVTDALKANRKQQK